MLLHVAGADVALDRMTSGHCCTVRSVSAASTVEAVRVGRRLSVAEVGAVTTTTNTPEKQIL